MSRVVKKKIDTPASLARQLLPIHRWTRLPLVDGRRLTDAARRRLLEDAVVMLPVDDAALPVEIARRSLLTKPLSGKGGGVKTGKRRGPKGSTRIGGDAPAVAD